MAMWCAPGVGCMSAMWVLVVVLCGGSMCVAGASLDDLPFEIVTSPGVPSSPSIVQVQMVLNDPDSGSGSGSSWLSGVPLLLLVVRAPRLSGVGGVLYDDSLLWYGLSVNGVELPRDGCFRIQPLTDNQHVIISDDDTNDEYRLITISISTSTSQSHCRWNNIITNNNQFTTTTITLMAYNMVGHSQPVYWMGAPQVASQAFLNNIQLDGSFPADSSSSSSSSSNTTLIVSVVVPLLLLVCIGVGAGALLVKRKQQKRNQIQTNPINNAHFTHNHNPAFTHNHHNTHLSEMEMEMTPTSTPTPTQASTMV